MFCRTRSLSNPFAVDRIISFLDVVSQIFWQILGQISMTPLDCLPSKDKIPQFGATFSTIISYVSRVTADFLLKFLNFRYHGIKGRCKENFKDTVKLSDPVKPRSGARISGITVTHEGYRRSSAKIPKFSLLRQHRSA